MKLSTILTRSVPLFLLLASPLQAADPVYKKYESWIEVQFPEGLIDMKHVMEVAQNAEGQNIDIYSVWIKNTEWNSWVQIYKKENIRFTEITFSQHGTPNLTEKRTDIVFKGSDFVPRRASDSMGISYDDSQGSKRSGALREWQSLIRNKHLNIVKGTRGTPMGPPEGYRPPGGYAGASAGTQGTPARADRVLSGETVSVSEGGRSFGLQEFSSDELILTRDDGKKVRFPRERTEFTRNLNLKNEDGILTVPGNSRKFDLRMFDAEMGFIGDTFAPKVVKGADGNPINVREEFEREYADLVEKERKAIDQGRAPEVEHVIEGSSKEIVASLEMNKSVKLIGPAGTGKSTEVKTLARLIAEGKIPGVPRTAQIRAVSLTQLAGGTKYVGTLETKLQIMTEYARSSRAILMMDEFHKAAGVGRTEGKSANMAQDLKPALEDGELRLIAISTTSEWTNAFSTDKAFDERFTKVLHEAPKGEELLRKIRNSFIMKRLPVPADSVILRAIELSDRYAITGAQPRKAVNLLLSATQIAKTAGNTGAAALENVNRAAIRSYDIDPAFFDRKKIFERVSTLEKNLSLKLGETEGVKQVGRLMLRKLSNVGVDSGADGMILFGPPGTGKTFFATLTSEHVGYKKVLIEMQKYATGDVEAFRHEVYQALSISPNTVIIFDELEKAHPVVQNAILAMKQPGIFTVNFQDGTNHVFEEVNCKNAVFFITTNAGQELLEGKKGPAVVQGLGAPRNSTKTQDYTDQDVVKALTRGGVSEPLVSRFTIRVAVPRPTGDEFRLALTKGVNEALSRESAKQGEILRRKLTFRLTNREELVNHLMKSYTENVTDYRMVRRMIEENLEPLISVAVLNPEVEGASVVRLEWNEEAVKLHWSDLCRYVLYKKDFPLKNLPRRLGADH